MAVRWLYALLILAVAILDTSMASWWSLGMPSSYPGSMDMSPESFKENCNRIDVLTEKQQRVLCPLSYNTLSSVGHGAKMGIDECQYQFHNSRWNCTTFGNTTSVFGGVLAVKSRETAFVYAVSAAGVAYAITRACSRGELNECTCENRERTMRLKEEREARVMNEGKLGQLKRLSSKELYPKKTKDGGQRKSKDESSPAKPKKNWKWGGCSEDIHYGEEFSRKFVDARENRESAEGLMNIHNNEAGRRSIRTRMQRVCKCHGMSGSCSMRVCWRKLPQFRQVGDALKARFEGASHVKVVDKRRDATKKLKAVSRELKPHNRTDLVYLEESPDYCERNETLGVLGTRRRLCNRTSIGLDGCQLLCCGRGYQTRVRDVEEKCKCRFVWCCNVVCEICRYKKEEHVCN